MSDALTSWQIFPLPSRPQTLRDLKGKRPFARLWPIPMRGLCAAPSCATKSWVAEMQINSLPHGFAWR
ncbi:MAG: phage DNA packaging protein J [Clostridia bacterium]|nr:phage DNA packaging protein J [Clostridia bacterium]MBQ6001057.1 phage DNA packaging protein J [Clostridia bacterium]